MARRVRVAVRTTPGSPRLGSIGFQQCDEMTIQDWIAQSLRDPAAQWSAGTYGAIAEFSRDPTEPADVVCAQFGGEASTARGGIRVELCKEVRAVAYETTAKNRDQWGHAIALVPAGGRLRDGPPNDDP